MMKIKTNYDKWQDATQTSGYKDQSRSLNIASIIKSLPNCKTILDIGSGSLVLKNYLGDGFQYYNADIIKRDESTFIVDLNKHEFVNEKFDCICLIGVLEYLNDIEWVLKKSYQYSNYIIFTYNFLASCNLFLKFFKIYQRNKLGWISHHSLESIFEILVKNDFKSIKFFPRSRQHNEEAVFLTYK